MERRKIKHNRIIIMMFSSFMPTFPELLLFIVIYTIVIIMINIFHYTRIEQKVKKHTRCKNPSDKGQTVYKLIATSMSNNDIFEVIYDFNKKTFAIEQLCPVGTVMNKVRIPVYNMEMYQIEEIDKIFSCEQNFDLGNGTNLIYKGDAELVRFMQFHNTDFFEKKLF